MKIIELLLPKKLSDKSLSPKKANKLDNLQNRMTGFVDKILDPKTSNKSREFLKTKLRSDYNELKDAIQELNEWRKATTYDIRNKTTPINPKGGFMTCDKCGKSFSRLGISRHRCIPKNSSVKEDDAPSPDNQVQYEVYDRKTGLKVSGRGPYNSRARAIRAVDQLDNAYGAYRYGYRPVEKLTEAVHKLPLSVDDFDRVKKVMERPIPAIVGPIYICEVIDDDELTDQINSFVENEPDRDIRPLVYEWLNRVMPDQMYRFTDDVASENQKKGLLSPIHGYSPSSHKGASFTNTESSGNAYGRR